MPAIEARPIQIGNPSVWRLYFQPVWMYLGEDMARDAAIRAYQMASYDLELVKCRAVQLKNRAGQPMTVDARRELTLRRMGSVDEVENAARTYAESLFVMVESVRASLKRALARAKEERAANGGRELDDMTNYASAISRWDSPERQRVQKLIRDLVPYSQRIQKIQQALGMLSTILSGELGTVALTHPRSTVISAYVAGQRSRVDVGGGFSNMITG